MKRPRLTTYTVRTLWIALSLLCAVLHQAVAEGTYAAEPAARKPNVILILADDLGYGVLSCYGQPRIRTPRLDRMASQGMRFTNWYAGSTVCAPSRCALMTGLHCGHATIRGNGQVPLRPDDVTVAEVLAAAGYATGLVGKWGLGEAGTSGIPTRQGFGYFYGYLNQNHAHNYYPDFLWRDEERVTLPNEVTKGVATKRVVYSPDLLTEEALAFIGRHEKSPFFLFLAYTQPHANNEAGQAGMETPDDRPYSAETWPQPQKNHAAMITRLDSDVGRILDDLSRRGLDDNTLVLFTSDNGPHKEGGADPEFFRSAGPLRGYKRSLHDGGIRVPMIARLPGRVPAGARCDVPLAHWDILPTLAELAGAAAPNNLDGISILPALTDQNPDSPRQPRHELLYWEFHEGGFRQAARQGPWKAVQLAAGGQFELYDVVADPGEERNLAAEHPDRLAEITRLIGQARSESPDWPGPNSAKRRAK